MSGQSSLRLSKFLNWILFSRCRDNSERELFFVVRLSAVSPFLSILVSPSYDGLDIQLWSDLNLSVSGHEQAELLFLRLLRGSNYISTDTPVLMMQNAFETVKVLKLDHLSLNW